ncbi:MAG: type B chloramphenicol O-acetyltransferase, partial [Vibrionaceae bacterium]
MKLLTSGDIDGLYQYWRSKIRNH